MAEISDRSMIFGLLCRMSIHVQLYAYMTLISKNMIENMTFVENNEISSSQKIT